MKWIRVSSLILLCALQACSSQVATDSFRVSFDSAGDLRDYLTWTEESTALIGAHRGGPEPGYPENCVPTFENALRYAPCLIECDVRMSKDSVLVMMHDETLDRTTTGSGKVVDHTLAELKELKLEDNEGDVTAFSIPTLAEILEWAKGRAVLELDVKRPVTPEAIVDIVEAHDAEASVIVITYNLPAALRYHELNPELVISASARGIEGAERLIASGIDHANLIAFVGVSEPDRALYDLLHANGIRAILGTMGNLDRRAKARGADIYRDLIENGADVLATDNVQLAAEAIGRSEER